MTNTHKDHMIDAKNHIVKSFNKDLESLQSYIAQMGSIAEEQLHQTMKSLKTKDQAISEAVIQRDRDINTLMHEIENQSVRLIALRQPMALDLRIILSAPKISVDLERIGDFISNIAKRAQTLFQLPEYHIPKAIFTMAEMAEDILHQILNGLMQQDIELAMAAWEKDVELDKIYSALSTEILEGMTTGKITINLGVHLLFIAKNIERISDHATNIAESAHFVIKGKHIEQKRPKHDTTSQTII
jgi:phosphate transport system protein